MPRLCGPLIFSLISRSVLRLFPPCASACFFGLFFRLAFRLAFSAARRFAALVFPSFKREGKMRFAALFARRLRANALQKRSNRAFYRLMPAAFLSFFGRGAYFLLSAPPQKISLSFRFRPRSPALRALFPSFLPPRLFRLSSVPLRPFLPWLAPLRQRLSPASSPRPRP